MHLNEVGAFKKGISLRVACRGFCFFLLCVGKQHRENPSYFDVVTGGTR